MRGCFAFLFLTFLSSSLLLAPGTSGQDLCPDPDDILPCTCSHFPDSFSVIADCSSATSSEEIFSAFNDVIWPFPELAQFLLIENEAVQELPEGVFGNVTFEAIIIFYAAVATVHPSALLPSKDRLYHVQIYFSGLADFPWEVLPELTHLYYLDLRNNYLTALPPVLSPSLTTLDLGGNRITRLESNWSAPNLTVLSFDYSPMSEVQHGFFWSLPNLQRFWCISCQLGQTILNGTLGFHSPALDLVSLEQSTISSLESHSITGFTADARIRLSKNQISELTEESFRPMLEVLSSGDGNIDLAENPVECRCSMAWIVLNPDFLGSVKGQCTNGTDFQDLDPEVFQDCI